MTKMQAIVQVTVRLPLDTEIEQLDLQPVREGDDRSPYVATNEKQVLKARRDAAKDAEKLAKETFKGLDVVDTVVIEVQEVQG